MSDEEEHFLARKLAAQMNYTEGQDDGNGDPCEVDDCNRPAQPCACGAAHCDTHPHVSEEDDDSVDRKDGPDDRYVKRLMGIPQYGEE